MKDEQSRKMEKEEENRNLVKHLQENPNGYCLPLIFQYLNFSVRQGRIYVTCDVANISAFLFLIVFDALSFHYFLVEYLLLKQLELF